MLNFTKMDILLTLLGSLIAFLAGACNGMMDISMGNFRRSRIAHWNPEFWEMFGVGQSWKNKYVGKDAYKRMRVTWKFHLFGKTIRVVKPVIILDGWHMMKFFWRALSALAVIPVAIVCRDINGVIVASSMLYFPQYFGFLTINRFLIKNS